MKAMTGSKKALFWKTNPEWYKINKEKDCYELTDKAPKEAIDSFKLFCSLRK